MATGDTTVNLSNSKAKRCAYFDGVDDNVEISGNILANENPGRDITAVTWSFWTYLNELNDLAGFIEKYATSGDRRSFYICLDAIAPYKLLRSNLSEDGVGFETFNSEDIVETKKWIHITITFNGATKTITYYKNGEYHSEDTQEITKLYKNTDITMSFGEYGNEGYLNGYLKNIQMWNRVLSGDEIKKVYQGIDIRDERIAKWKCAEDFSDSEGRYDAIEVDNSGFTAIEDEVTQDLTDARTGENDRWQVFPLGSKIMSVHIEE